MNSDDKQDESISGTPASDAEVSTRDVIHVYHKYVLLVTCVVGFLLIDGVTGWLCYGGRFGPDDPALYIMFFLIGICIAKLNLLAMWAAIGSGNYVVRLPLTMLLTVLGWYAMVIGCRIDSPRYPLHDAIYLGLILGVASIFMQIPMWIAGNRFGWRFTAWDGSKSSEGTRYDLRHLMIATFLVAIPLALLKPVLPEGPLGIADVRLEVNIVLLIVLLTNLVLILPSIRRTLRTSAGVGSSLLHYGVRIALVTLIEFICMMAILGPPTTVVLEVFSTLFLVNLGQVIAVFFILRTAAGLGCKLTQIRPTEPEKILSSK